MLAQFERQMDALDSLSGTERQAALDHWYAIIDGGDCADTEILRSICMLYGYLIGQGLYPSGSEKVKEAHRMIIAERMGRHVKDDPVHG